MAAFARALVIVFAACGACGAQANGPADRWEPFRFLIGAWEGESKGQPGAGTSRREYRFVLNGRFIEVRNRSVYPAQTKDPTGEIHEDFGLISYDRGRNKYVFRQFHTEGS